MVYLPREVLMVSSSIAARRINADRYIPTAKRSCLMSNKIELPNSWVCTGGELKPKSGASLSNTWMLSGKEIKPKSGATLSNTWVWDGKELKPKSGATLSNTWVVSGGKVKPKSGATLSNTFEIGTLPILVVAGKLVLRLW